MSKVHVRVVRKWAMPPRETLDGQPFGVELHCLERDVRIAVGCPAERFAEIVVGEEKEFDAIEWDRRLASVEAEREGLVVESRYPPGFVPRKERSR